MVFVELSLTASLRKAEAEAATALLSSNENKTMAKLYVLLPDIAEDALWFSTQNDENYQGNTIECHRKTTYYMYIQF
jgi:hypothetical protein